MWKQYVGVKVVVAKPMTRGDYNDYRGWQIPTNENPADEGYVVEYDHGYISWCPKEVFEKHNYELTGHETFDVYPDRRVVRW